MGRESVIRLKEARKALQATEEKQGVQSYEHRFLLSDDIDGGVYYTGNNLVEVTTGLKTLLATDRWAAFVGIKNVGWEAMQQQGIELERVAKVDVSVEETPEILTLLLEGFEILLLGDFYVSPMKQRVLAAKARMLNHFILTTKRWQVGASLFVKQQETFGKVATSQRMSW